MGDFTTDFKGLIKAFQPEGHDDFITHQQRSLGFDEQPICADILDMIGENPVIGGVIDGDAAGLADAGSFFLYQQLLRMTQQRLLLLFAQVDNYLE